MTEKTGVYYPHLDTLVVRYSCGPIASSLDIMRTEKQKLTSIENGAKSRGPVTDSGKARASQNAVRHGLSSRVVVLACEDEQKYEEMLREYYEHWQPANQPERDLVNDIAACRWRLNRIVALETALIDLEMDRGFEDFKKNFVRADEGTRCAVAYRSLTDESRTLANLSRHESRLRRAIEHATNQLRELQEQRKNSEQEKFQNEPAEEQPQQIQTEAPTGTLTPSSNECVSLERASWPQTPMPRRYPSNAEGALAVLHRAVSVGQKGILRGGCQPPHSSWIRGVSSTERTPETVFPQAANTANADTRITKDNSARLHSRRQAAEGGLASPCMIEFCRKRPIAANGALEVRSGEIRNYGAAGCGPGAIARDC